MLWLIVTDGASCLTQELMVIADYVTKICPHVDLCSFHIHNPTDRVKGYYGSAEMAIDCRKDNSIPLGQIYPLSETVTIVTYNDWWVNAKKIMEDYYDRPRHEA